MNTINLSHVATDDLLAERSQCRAWIRMANQVLEAKANADIHAEANAVLKQRLAQLERLNVELQRRGR